jgi:chemotaxis protein CheD
LKALVVGISDCIVSNDPEAVLVTYALGSCIAVALYDPAARVGGLLHYMLPEAALDVAKAVQNPYMFGDTGIPKLLRTIGERGGAPRRLKVWLAGGAQILDGHELFQIGRRNYLAARKLLWKAGILLAGEAVGGEVSRTVRVEVGTGRVWVREGGGPEQDVPEERRSARGT